MNDFIRENLKKLKDSNIANPNLDLRIILNHCSKVKKDIFFSNFTASDIDIIKFNHLFKMYEKVFHKKSWNLEIISL